MATIVVLSLVTTNLVPSNASPSLNSAAYSIIYPPHWPSSHDVALDHAIATIPSNASVLTTSKLFTYVSSRPGAYTIKYGNLFAPPWNYQNLIDHYLNLSSFVLLDFEYDALDGLVYGLTGNLSSYGVRAAGDGAYVYERGWSAPPTYFAPETLTYAASQLVPINAFLDSSVGSPYGPSIYHQAGGKSKAVIWSGPNLESLPTGRYQATFWLDLNAPVAGPQLELSATETPMSANVTIAQSSSQGVRYNENVRPSAGAIETAGGMNLSRLSNQSTSIYGNYSFDFDWPGFGYLNLKGIELSTTMSVRFFAVFLTQLSA